MSNHKFKIICTLYSVLCTLGLYANSPYISHVWEYVPAPGQFVNEIPKYEIGDTKESMRQKAETQIANNAQGLISLGGWGGYVVFSFDHPIANMKGQKDFIVEGNTAFAGSSEPGIVMVSYDANGNGQPDDEWFELAGSEYNNPQTIHDYQVTYERPAANHKPTPDPNQKYRIDTTHVKWTDNKGGTGFLVQISFHTQDYYPKWISANTMTFKGARLPDNYTMQGSNYIQTPYDYGYVDNTFNSEEASQLDISWAVKADGTPVQLNAIHFVKVYTAVHEQCGTIGEASTEVKGAKDLHPNAPTGLERVQHSAFSIQKRIQNGQFIIIRDNRIYNPLGIHINNY